MITLYSSGPRLGLPDSSPFASKAEILLKMSGLPYDKARADFAKAPKGKIPYIADGDRPLMGDTTLIRWYLEQRYGIDFDAGLSPAEKATAWAYERLCEDHLYWCGIIQTRWMNRDNFKRGPSSFFAGIPAPIRPFIVSRILRKVRRDLFGQGLGRHSEAEIAQFAIRDMDAISAFLDDKPWLMGETPCGADAAVWSMVTGALCPAFDSPVRAAAEGHANLVAYRDRGMARWFPDMAATPGAAKA